MNRRNSSRKTRPNALLVVLLFTALLTALVCPWGSLSKPARQGVELSSLPGTLSASAAAKAAGLESRKAGRFDTGHDFTKGDALSPVVQAPLSSSLISVTSPNFSGIGTSLLQSSTPSISNISPGTTAPGSFSLTVNGSSFNTSTAQIVVTGPNCPTTTSCVVPNNVLTSKSSNQIVGPLTINTTGSYTIQVQNGSGATLSNGATLTVSNASPSINNISPTSVTPGSFSLTINGSNFNTSNIQIVVTGPDCPATTSCVVPNNVLTSKSSSQIAGPVTINTSGSFTIRVQNGSGATLSNSATLTVNSASPSINNISPANVTAGTFSLTVNGSNFNTSNAQIVITGPNCPTTTSCVVPNNVLTSKSNGQLVGPVTINTPGSFTIQVQNGSGTALSNGATLTVTSATPTISNISPTSVNTGTFSLTINGSNFNTSNVQIVITGPNCPTTTSCVVPNNALTSKSSSQIAGPVTINTAGSFTIQVQNGSGTTLSNGATLTVNSVSPSINNISPTSVSTGAFSLTINGSNFDTSTAQIVLTGPNCPTTTSCVVPNNVLTSKSSSQIVGPVTINTPGSFTIQVQNGSGTTLSNGATLTINATGPTIQNISPTTATPETFPLTVNGNNFDPATAQIVVTGPNCPTTTSCVVPNNVLTTKNANQIVGSVTVNVSGSFTIQVQNGSGTALSNGATLTVNVAGPTIQTISPTTATPGTFPLTINGTNFDPATAQIVVTGPNCPTTTSCLVPNNVLTTKNANQIIGPVTVNVSGGYTIQVQNGSGTTLSNGATLTVNAGGPTIQNISPTTATLGTFPLTINGNSFDPSTAQIVVTGPNCPTTTSCVVPNNVLTTKNASQIIGPVTVNVSGSYTIQVQNGSGATLSNGATLTVQGSTAPDIATFVSETILDGTRMTPGQTFNKTWTIRNSGTTTWNPNYRLKWVGGSNLSSHGDLFVIGTVAPGANYTFILPATAPISTGSYREDWKFVTEAGTTILVGGSSIIWLSINVGNEMDAASFVRETILDGTTMQAGQNFAKTWTIRNSGTTTWNSAYKLRWKTAQGPRLSSQNEISVVGVVSPGGTYTFSVPMAAPTGSGSYREDWQFENASRVPMQVGPSSTIWVSINVGGSPTTQCGTADQMRARIQQRIQNNSYVLFYQPSGSDTELLLSLNLAAYDELYFSALRYRSIVQTTLLIARKFIDQGNLEAACQYMRRADRLFNLRTQIEGAAVLVWDTRVSGAQEVVAEIISATCSIEAELLGHRFGPAAGSVADGLCVMADYAVDKSIYGEDEAIKRLGSNIRNFAITKFLHIGLDELGGRTIAQWMSNGGFKYDTNQSVVNNYLKKALQKSGSREVLRNALAALGDATLNERLDYFTDKFLNNYLDGLSSGGQANTSFKDNLQTSKGGIIPRQAEGAPEILSTSPARSAVAVKTSLSILEVTFDEPIQAGSLSIAMTDAGSNSVALNNISVQNNALRASLATQLKPRSVYTVTLRAGAIRNSSGVANEEYQWTFTTEPAALSIGSGVQVSNTGGAGVDLRSSPNFMSTDNVVVHVQEGVRLRIVGGPQLSDGYTWWNVTGNGQAGWIATGKWLLPIDQFGLHIGAQITVSNTNGTGPLLREEPRNSGAIIGRLSEGTPLIIVGGPYLVDGYAWWSLKGDLGTGFCPTADWLVPDLSASTTLSNLTVTSFSPNAGAIIAITPVDVNGLGNGTTQFQRIYSSNTIVSLTAPSAVGGSSFQKWQRDGVDWSSNLTTDLTMDAAHLMTAVYLPGPAIAINSASYLVDESTPRIDISVVRSGDPTGNASVNFATTVAPELSNCNIVNGNASPRCDFVGAFGTINFAPGETTKTVPILITNDSYSEGPETFTVVLSNPLGASLGPQSSATVTINDDDPAPGANPVDQPSFFVDEHYGDFLGRLSDPSGRAFWTNQITACGSDAGCIEVRRINVSASFFLSIEFQDTGYLVERIYKTAYGEADGSSTFGGAHTLKVPIVRLNDFLADSQQIGQGVVVLQQGWEQALDNNKNAFAAAFVQRTRFINAFPPTMTPAEFVDKLFLNAGVTPSAADRNAAIDEFGSATNTSDVAARGHVLRRVAENGVLRQLEFNKAFVLMQYFGYLRRNPNDPQDSDHTGYDFWLTKLNQFNSNYINAEMVKAFLSSIEYRQRFGP